jgi:serine/threonine-protein kinase
MTISLRDRIQTSLGDTYTLEREVGGGGMSHVFVADDAALGRKVIVKVLSTELTGSVNVERFNREIRVAATLQHPCIVPVHAAGEVDGLPYYTMPLVEGETLRSRLSREHALPIGDVTQIIRDVAQALSYAHGRGIVHRDIKPENILLSQHHALVTDFGIAKALSASAATPDGDAGTLTQLGMALGTPAYMSPEQALADPTVDHRADLYSLGVMAYEALTGRPLFTGSPAALVVAHATELPKPIKNSRPDVPAALDALVMRLLAKKPAERMQSADEVLAALDTPAKRFPPRARLLVSAAAVIAIAIAATLFASRRTAQPSADVVSSIAVLPFVNRSGDSKDDFLGEGLSEELIDALSKIERLKVAARASSFRFRGDSANLRDVGRRLGVGSVLTGSVRRAGNKLRVTAQLVNAGSGFNLWSEQYDREMTDVFAMQDDITRAIVGALRVQLGTADRDAIQARPARNIQAYESYLKGLSAWRQRGQVLMEAVRYFSDAIAADSTYAPAYAALSGALLTNASWSYLSTTEAVPRARAAALKAIALDSTLAEGHSALADILCGDNEVAAAEQAFKRAIQLNPGLANAHNRYSWCLMKLTRYDDAIREASRALELDPLNQSLYAAIGAAYLHARRYREGVEALEPARGIPPDQSPTHGWRSQLLAQLGDSTAAINECRKAIQLTPGTTLWTAACAGVYAFAGQADSARAMLRVAERDTAPSNYWIAASYAALGDRDRAFTWLNRAFAEGSAWTREMLGPGWDRVRNDPRYAPLARKLAIPSTR